MGVKENLITGIAVGGGIMFLLDPLAGRRRRALVRDKSVRWTKQTSRALRTTWRRVEGTSRGIAATVRHFRSGGTAEVDDGILEQRLRNCIARHSSHPRAIVVTVENGCVKLNGPVLAAEVREVLSCASEVRGVRAVDNGLEVHETPGNVPGLQGEPHPHGWQRAPRWQTTVAAAAAGLGAVLLGRRVLAGDGSVAAN